MEPILCKQNVVLRRTASSGMLHRVALVRTDFVVLHSMCWLPVMASVVPSSLILVNLMKETPSSSKTAVLKEPCGVTSQNTPFFIVTAVKTSNLFCCCWFFVMAGGIYSYHCALNG
jgi:hypothetical protein